MSDAFVFPCTKLPKRPFWKSRPNYSLEYAGGAFKQRVALDFESIPDYPRDRDQWMSSQIQFQLPNTVEHVSPFSMSSALPLLKANSSADVKSVTSSERANTGSNPVNLSYTSPDASDFLLGGRGYAAVNHDPFGLPAIPELSWSARLSAAEADNGHSNAGSHVHLPDTNEEDDSFTHSNPVPVLIPGGPGSNSSTHSGLTSDSAPRTPPMEAQKDYFVATHTQPEGYSHEAYPAAPHSYLSSPSTLYLRDSWGQFVLDAQSHYVSTAGSTHNTNTELRSNRPPSTIEERGEKWAGEVPNVWSLFSATPTSGAMKLPPTPPIPIQPQSQPVAPSTVPRPLTQTQTTLMINPIFAHILWDIRYPPASASLITSKSKARTLTDPDSWTRGLSEVEVVAPATYPPKSTLLISSPHTRWRARVESEGGEGEYVSVADVLHALHDQLVLRFVKQAEWDKLDDRTKWYVGRAYGRNRLDDPSDADAASMNSGFSGAAGSVWSEGSRMSGESIVCGPGTAWGEGVRRADVLRDRTMFGGLRVDPAYKRKRRMQGSEADADESLLVMELKRVERPTSMTSV